MDTVNTGTILSVCAGFSLFTHLLLHPLPFSVAWRLIPKDYRTAASSPWGTKALLPLSSGWVWLMGDSWVLERRRSKAEYFLLSSCLSVLACLHLSTTTAPVGDPSLAHLASAVLSGLHDTTSSLTPSALGVEEFPYAASP